MRKHPVVRTLKNLFLIAFGAAMFALGFDLFLQPHHINVGGVSGIGQVLAHVTDFGTVALWSLLINIPLFLLAFKGVGRNFFFGSLAGMLFSNLFLTLFSGLPVPQTEPLLASLYGGLMSGVGLGFVFIAGASSGGSDVLARLLRPKFPNLPIGRIMLAIDTSVIIITGIAFGDLNKTLYSAVTIYVCTMSLDMVVYGLDYSTVAMIVSDQYEQIGRAICEKLDRGVTVLDGRGFYSGNTKQVLLSAIKKRQAAELKQLVTDIDPNAFVILQESHQVLGEGFKRYSKNDL
jgi:uncharacterized membrane-anchored protein YitT (DUF2179 family)